MKYIITHTCGHDEEVELFGKGTERKRRIAAMEAHECPECRAKHAAERDNAKGYAALKGSPKQVAWATDIRETLFQGLSKFYYHRINGIAKGLQDGMISDEQAAQLIDSNDADLLVLMFGLMEETSASWIINHRNDGEHIAFALADRHMK